MQEATNWLQRELKNLGVDDRSMSELGQFLAQKKPGSKDEFYYTIETAFKYMVQDARQSGSGSGGQMD